MAEPFSCLARSYMYKVYTHINMDMSHFTTVYDVSVKAKAYKRLIPITSMPHVAPAAILQLN